MGEVRGSSEPGVAFVEGGHVIGVDSPEGPVVLDGMLTLAAIGLHLFLPPGVARLKSSILLASHLKTDFEKKTEVQRDGLSVRRIIM